MTAVAGGRIARSSAAILGLVAALLIAASQLAVMPALSALIIVASITGFLLLSWSWILLGTDRDAIARLAGGYTKSRR